MKAFAIAAACAASLVASPAFADQRDFRLVNRTGYVVDQVYVSPAKADDWEEDVLGRDQLADDEFVDISFSGKANTCIYDMKLVYSDGEEATWTKLNLCEVSKISVRYTKSGETIADFD
jgi:hypothetical protein